MHLLTSGRTKVWSSGGIFTPNTDSGVHIENRARPVGVTVDVGILLRVLRRRPRVSYQGTAGTPVPYPCRSARTPARTAHSRTHHSLHTRPYVPIVELCNIFFAQNHSLRKRPSAVGIPTVPCIRHNPGDEKGPESPTGNRESPGPPAPTTPGSWKR